jgi:ATP-binding cassette subfamily C exporter for protease/lipase
MKQKNQTELRSVLGQLTPYLSVGLLQAAVLTVLALAPLGYMREVYGPVLNARSNATLLFVTLLLVFLVVISGFIDWTRTRVLTAASVRLNELLAHRVFDAAFKANLDGRPGAKNALSDFQGIRQFINSPAMAAILDAPFATFFLVLVFFIHPLIGALTFAGATLAFIVALMTEREVRGSMRQAYTHANDARDALAAITKNAQAVEGMGMSANLLRRWQKQHDNFLAEQSVASATQSVGQSASKVVMLLQGSIVLGVGTLLFLTGVLSIQSAAMLIIAKLLGGMAMKPILQLISSWKLMIGARDQYTRLEAFLEQVPQKEPSMPLPAPQGHLSVYELTARPVGAKYPTIRDITFEMKPGRLTAVIGPSGSGKSTLARVLVGLWQPLTGSARLDGVDIFKWDKDELGRNLGYLPQDVELFEGTLAQNIARFGDIDMDQLSLAISRAGLTDVIAGHPGGINMQIGNNGHYLSGGQRQRVGLARAIYGTPKLIVLDEPNANLDEVGDAILMSTLKQLKAEGCTIVVISHKKSLLRVSDYLLVLASGRPKLFGPTAKVIEKMQESLKPPAQAIAQPPVNMAETQPGPASELSPPDGAPT